ncbi:MAG: TetR family transcriptional regulator [Cycloclasticus sp. Phe_18]|jgi:AcrR family transcriptional regulator|nr:MAG: TetR family transcriptional regulator [Cycloclasticus sp. Phe_18]
MTDKIQQPPNKSSKRIQIVEAACQLFKENGFYATGVDLIMRRANVSKRTMYIYFPTKNELIVAVLKHYHADYQASLAPLLSDPTLDSRAKILEIFAVGGDWFENRQFHGCLAVNAMGEFADKDPAIEQACRDFKAWELAMFTELTSGMVVQKPDDLAYKLFILLEGLGAIAKVLKQPCPIPIRQMVNELIDNA